MTANGNLDKKISSLSPEEDIGIQSVEKVHAALSKAEREENLKKFVQENFHERDDTSSSPRPSKSFGKINFRGSSHSYFKPRYLRLSDEDSADDVLKLMTEHWQLAEPKLVVSIVGGANRFDNGQFSKNRIQTLFKQGLPEIAMATGAWIITPGSKSGVYQMVGSAVRDYSDSTGASVMNNIVVMGISSWGAVSERERLESADGQGMFPASYPTANIFGKKRTHQPIDPNHSHFLLVDDGTRDKFGGEEKWRATFESKLAKWSMTTGSKSRSKGEPLHIPFVVLLVNGGDGSLQTCAEKLDDKVPLLAIAGSGRAAEVVISIKKFVGKRQGEIPTHDQFLRLYVDAMGYAPSGSEVYDWMKTIAEFSKYVSVFDFIQPGINTDDIGLDRALLAAIYHPDEMTVEKRKAEMRLAIAWKNVEYAKYEIFNIRNADYTKFIEDREFFSELAMLVLLDDMPDLMALFMDHGLDLVEFVTDDRLCYLYEQAMMRGDAFSRFMKNTYDSAVAKRMRCVPCGGRKVSSERSECLLTIGEIIKDLLGYSFPNVYKQAGAIVGAAVLRGLAKRSNHQEGVDITVQYSTNSLNFEALANGILECCWAKDRQYTSDMLVREAPSWGHTTVLSMAYHAEMEEFLAQPACYTKLTKLWRGDIALRTHPGWIMLFAVCPLFIFALKFVRKRDSDTRMDEHRLDPLVILDSPSDHSTQNQLSEYKQIVTVSMCGAGKYELSLPKALYKAMSAPIVKCVHYSILFLTFLVVYSLFLMTELRPYITHTNSTSAITSSNSTQCQTCCLNMVSGVGCLELATYACLFSYLLEEIRQVIFRDTRSLRFLREKFHDWIIDFWNQVDVLSYLLFMVAVFLRFYLEPQYFEVARWMFCITLVVLFTRFSQVFFIAEQLGPKVIMIRKMMVDLAFFVMILLLVIIVFGVILQSIVNPESELKWDILNAVFYYPYFQMYGELFLEDGLFKTDYQWILLAFYMMITNVLLLNLLIAMFRLRSMDISSQMFKRLVEDLPPRHLNAYWHYTFDKVQEKSEILWKFNYYAVVYEHYDRPYFPLIGTIVDIVRAMKCSERCISKDDSNDFRRKLNQDKNDKITKFVKLCMEKFMAQESKRLQEDMAHKVNDTAHRLGMVIEQLDDLRDDVMKPESVSLQFDQQSLESRSKAQTDVTRQLEKKMDSLERKLDKVMEAIAVKQ